MQNRRPTLCRVLLLSRSTIIAGLLLAGLAFATQAADLPKATRGEWIEARSPNFTLFSNAKERETIEIARDLEQLRAALGGFAAFELSSPVSTWIYVFATDRAFRPYKFLQDGKPANITGAYFDVPHGNYIALSVDGRVDARNVVYHEYTHYFIANNLSGAPAWLDEGLAEYFSTFEVKNSSATLGRLVPHHLSWLRRNAMIPLNDLLAVDRQQADGDHRDRESTFYAQSWALVHFLLNGWADDVGEQTNTLFEQLAGGADPVTAFHSAMDTDLEEVEKQLARYVANRRFLYRKRPVDVREVAVDVSPITQADALFRLGDLLAAQRNRPMEAAQHFEAALAADPDHGLGHAGLGYLKELEGDWVAARASYAKALELRADDFLTHYRLGNSWMQSPAARSTWRGNICSVASS